MRPKGPADTVAAAIRAIVAYGTKEAITAQWDHVADALADRVSKAVPMHRTRGECSCSPPCPKHDWRQVWSTNAFEGAQYGAEAAMPSSDLPNGATVLRLAGAVTHRRARRPAAERRDASEASMHKLAEARCRPRRHRRARDRRPTTAGDRHLNSHPAAGRHRPKEKRSTKRSMCFSSSAGR